MRRKLLLLVGVAIAGGLLFPSVAAPSSSSDRVSEDIALEPYQGAGGNGEYAVLESVDGGQELALRFGPSNPNVDADGVAADAVTPVDRVFNVTYTGDGQARVWVSSDLDGLSFYRGTDPTATIEERTDAVTLGSNGTLVVGVRIDTTEQTEFGTDQFTVHAEVPDESTATPTAPDGPNDGSQSSGASGFGGGVEVTEQRETSQQPTTTETTTITDDGTAESGPRVRTVDIETRRVAPGDPIRIVATVENRGTQAGTVTIPLRLGGERVGTETVRVPAGESRTVTFTHRLETAGTYSVDVGGVADGEVVVEAVAGTSPTPADVVNSAPQTPAKPAGDEQPATDVRSESGGEAGGTASLWLVGAGAGAVLGGSLLALGTRRYWS